MSLGEIEALSNWITWEREKPLGYVYSQKILRKKIYKKNQI